MATGKVTMPLSHVPGVDAQKAVIGNFPNNWAASTSGDRAGVNIKSINASLFFGTSASEATASGRPFGSSGIILYVTTSIAASNYTITGTCSNGNTTDAPVLTIVQGSGKFTVYVSLPRMKSWFYMYTITFTYNGKSFSLSYGMLTWAYRHRDGLTTAGAVSRSTYLLAYWIDKYFTS